MSKYKNPNLIPQGLADHIRKLERERNESLRVLNLIYGDKQIRFGMDKETNEPISEILARTIRNMESEEDSKPTHDADGYPIAQTKADHEDYAMTQSEINQFNKPLIP